MLPSCKTHSQQQTLWTLHPGLPLAAELATRLENNDNTLTLLLDRKLLPASRLDAMAAKGTAAVGSTTWIAAEKENVLHLLQAEKDELVFPVQHELEWLNEHMAEIFSRSHV